LVFPNCDTNDYVVLGKRTGVVTEIFDMAGWDSPSCGSFCFTKKQQAHRVPRPVGHSLLIDGSNYFCFVVSPFM
jgi:hypothetical protein